ncbi:glycoside hydrolase superfamily [Aspergillus cavernicola]|uniref:Glycoside hydrolase superfamily n=1 Tax=Aspergillus cavernicola TaxID=176166 RepID=A0ABR4HQG5_9EURO
MSELFHSKPLDHDWTVKDAQGSNSEAWLPVSKIPSVIHLDLLDNGVIPDPFVGLNEQKAEWVAHRDWIYRTTFPTSERHSLDVRYSLLFEGLDTFATVTVNDTVILRSNNMFIPHRPRLRKKNTLSILFESPIRRGREVVQSHPGHRYIAHQTEVGRLGSRKAAYHWGWDWGWDWGPILVTSGPWRPVRLEMYVDRIEDLWMRSEVSRDLGVCSGSVHMRTGGLGGADRVRFGLRGEEGGIVFEIETVIQGLDGMAEAEFRVKNPALWFPRGYGEQRRYELRAELFKGIVELVQEEDGYGKSFYFRINNIDVFSRGSCWIPGESFLPRLTDQKYQDWLKLMIEGHQNMIRIWGGDIFEPEIFYETCDKLGIMVWQDFLFACASYPTYPLYLESVEQEARANMRLLRHHPSIVIYARNNEDYQIQQTYNLAYDYKVVEEECPGLPYHPSSPWGGGKHTTDPTIGDIHRWDVWHGTMQPYQNLASMGGRFVSEFGMEAYPHMYTINAFINNPEEKYHQSLTMDFHNKARDHERRLGFYILQNFKIKQELKSYLYLSQLAQSETMTYAYRSWRRDWGRAQARRSSQLLAIGVSRTYHDWVSGHARPPSTSRFDVWVASSRLEPVTATVEIRYISIATGNDVVPASIFRDIKIQSNETTDILSDSLNYTQIPYTEPIVIPAKLIIADEVISRDTDWPQPLKYLGLKDRGVEVEYLADEKAIRVTAAKPTKGVVFEERPGLWFVDNGVDVVPGDERVIHVRGVEGLEGVPGWSYL